MRENRALKLPQTNAYLSPVPANLQHPNGPFRGQKIIWDCFSDRFMYLPVLILIFIFYIQNISVTVLVFLSPSLAASTSENLQVTEEASNTTNTGIIRQIKRSRKPPATKKDDFLW
jgi:hypothetical protein